MKFNGDIWYCRLNMGSNIQVKKHIDTFSKIRMW